MKNKKVYFIGAGPGDPGLITVRGRNALRQADVIIYDYLCDKRLLDEAASGAELINRLEIKKGVTDLITRKVREGKKVVRLKGGDPAVFGRFSQELSPLVKKACVKLCFCDRAGGSHKKEKFH